MSSQAHEAFLTGNQVANHFEASDGYSNFFISSHHDRAVAKHKHFYTDKTPVRWSRSRVIDVKHVKLELSFDIAAKRVIGISNLTFSAITDEVSSLTLDACDMELGEIRCDGDIPFATSYDGEKLRVDFESPLPHDRELTISIPYTVTDPQAGIYFVGPDEDYPDKPVEIWTQGQDEDSRFWYPCFDYPNERLTSEVVVTVESKFTTLSNGALLSTKDNGDGTKTWHWKHDTPHVSYLVSLVVGELELVEDQWDGIPVNYYARKEDLARAKNSFGQTPDMVRYFSEKIGVRYPYAKYAQVAATDFIFGGMENTTATTQTSYTLHDDRAHLDFSSNPLVSQELAHQWFGDLITCRDWSHGWLNEGFTTYMECCWQQEELGDDEFQYYVLTEMEGYIAEDKNSYRRPLVCNRYEEPIDVFDRHLYEKGACIQHMLRFILGERLFWKALKHYTEKHAGGAAITQDWQTAIEEATGRNMDEFFDQFVYKGGHPDFKLSFKYDAKLKLAALTVKQTQKPDSLTSIYKLPVDVAFSRVEEGKEPQRQTTRIEVCEGEQVFHIPLDFDPSFITFDPGNWILKTLDISGLSEGMLIDALKHDTDGVARVHAARELGKKATRRATEALAEVLASDTHWFVQGECGAALGKVGSPTAMGFLLEHRGTKHPKARRAVVKALGEFRGEAAAADALLAILDKGDDSYFVESEAATSLGKTRDPRAFDALVKAVAIEGSHNDVIPIGAMEGLLKLEDLRGLDAIRSRCKRGVMDRTRMSAMMKLGTLAKLGDDALKNRVRQELEAFLLERDFFARLGGIAGLSALGERSAIPALRKCRDTAVDGRMKGRASKAIEKLARGASGVEQGSKLREEVEELRKQNKKLAERLDKLEAVGEVKDM